MNVTAPPDPRPARTLARRAYRWLRRDIVQGRLPAGSKLRLESLVQEYAIGMSPLREALARLAGDRLVTSQDQRGFWVAPLTVEDLDDIHRLRILVAGEALRTSVARGDSAWEAGLRAALARLDTTAAPEAWSDLDPDEPEDPVLRFHQALLGACGSPWLLALQELLHRQAERYRLACLPDACDPQALRQTLATIAQAAFVRDADAAWQGLSAHLARTHAAVRQALEQAPPAR